MAIPKNKVIKIKVDYEAGILTKSNIANKHEINRLTLYKLADRHSWEYGKNKHEISKITEEKSLENLINKQVDRATEITNQFLGDIDKHRQLLMMTTNELVKAFNEHKDKKDKDGKAVKIPKEEFDRIFAGSKITKIQMEALNVGFTGARKALGMDIIDLRSGDGSLTPESPQNSIERTIELVKKAMGRGIDADKITSVSNDN